MSQNTVINIPAPSAFPFPGCRLEIVSTDGTRYQGRITAMDFERRCVTLVEVQHFGTEDRDAAAEKPAKGLLPPEEERVFFEQFIHYQRVVTNDGVADAGMLDFGLDATGSLGPPSLNGSTPTEVRPNSSASNSMGDGANTSPSQQALQLGFMKWAPEEEMGRESSAMFPGSGSNQNSDMLLIGQQDGGGKREVKEEDAVEEEDSLLQLLLAAKAKKEKLKKKEKKREKEKKRSSTTSSSLKSSHKRKSTADSRDGPEEQRKAKKRKRIVCPSPSPPRAYRSRSHSVESEPTSSKRGRPITHERSTLRQFARHHVRTDSEKNFPGHHYHHHFKYRSNRSPSPTIMRPRYFIAQMQEHSYGKRRAVGVLVNKHHVGNDVPVYMAFHLDPPSGPEVLVGEIWQVPCYSWIANRRLTYHQFVPSGRYSTLNSYVREVCGGALPWLTDNEVNAEAIAIGRGMMRITEPEEKFMSARVVACGSTITGTGWVRKWVQVEASDLVWGVRIDASQFTSSRGRRLDDLHNGDKVHIKAVRLEPGCFVGPSYVLPRNVYHADRPPFHPHSYELKHASDSRGVPRVVRTKGGEYFPMWLFDA